MVERIVLLHSQTPGVFKEFDAVACTREWQQWNTCLRSIRIAAVDDYFVPCGVETYRGAEAYRFCLEVVSGLHSPLVGETEVLGQFKDLAKSVEAGRSSGDVKRFFRMILSDAKGVRQSHLTNLGSQSYGSLTRKFLKQSRAIHVLGAGKLTAELLPWLKEFTSVEIFCRTPEKARALASRFKNARILPMGGDAHEKTDGNALIIAAPISSSDILTWIREHGHGFQTLLDLRGEATADPISGFDGETVSLGKLFSSVRENQVRISKLVEAAKTEICRLSDAKVHAQELHPFGWDDLCG